MCCFISSVIQLYDTAFLRSIPSEIYKSRNQFTNSSLIVRSWLSYSLSPLNLVKLPRVRERSTMGLIKA